MSPACEHLTGERTWPGIPEETYWFMRHVACYRWAASWLERAPQGSVLDAGAGEGYGAKEVSGISGRPVVAVELDAAAATHAHHTYPDIASVRANLVSLPCADDSFAACVSLQVVEHLWDPIAYLRELARCTRGPIVISTPNRPVHSPHLRKGQKPDNVFHVQEFDADELLELLELADPSRKPQLFGLGHGARIREWEKDHGGLMSALLSGQTNDHTVDEAHRFATSITDADFTIFALHDLPLQDLPPQHTPQHHSAQCHSAQYQPPAYDLITLW